MVSSQFINLSREYWDTIWLKKASRFQWGMRTTPAALSWPNRKAARDETHWFSDKYDGLLDEAAKTRPDPVEIYQELNDVAEDVGV